MCSRHTLHHPIGLLAQYFQAAVSQGAESIQPSHNIAPSNTAVVIVQDGIRKLVPMAAGLLSPIEDRPKRYINARAETIDQLPTFRDAFRNRRCLIPMSGFFEPDHVTMSKEPYYVHMEDNRPFAAAGIWEATVGPAGRIYSYSIITVPANHTVEKVHDRMPAILDEQMQETWLDSSNDDIEGLKRVLQPYGRADLVMYRVSRSLYRNLSIGPECIEPISIKPAQPSLFT